VRANQALYDYTTAYGVPCISGKDSMKNDYQIAGTKISVPPTILFSTIGRIEDVRKAVTMDAKRAGDLVYVLGMTYDELGGSEWYAAQGFVGNRVPKVNAVRAKKLYTALSKAIDKGLVASCHDCADGGLGVALAETAFSGDLGMAIDLKLVPAEGITRNDVLLFSETQSRFVVTIRPEAKPYFDKIMKANVFAEVGRVCTKGIFEVSGLDGKVVIKEAVSKMKEAWQAPLRF